MTLLRALIFQIGFVLWTATAGVAGLPLMVAGWRPILFVARVWAAGAFLWLRLTVGLRYEVRGLEHRPTGPALLAVKHQAAWETMALGLVVPTPAIVYKRELTWMPLVGWYMWAAGMIPIDRGGGASALRRMLAAARRAVLDGRQVTIFPEGTRVPVGGTVPYLPGVGALYTHLGLPIVPVAVNSGHFWPRRILGKRPGCVVMEFLPPIAAGLDRRDAMAELRARIDAATERLRGLAEAAA